MTAGKARGAGTTPEGSLGLTGSSSGEHFDYFDGRARREALRWHMRRFVDRTPTPVYSKDEDGHVVIGADGSPVVRRMVARHDRYLACGVRRADANAGHPVRWGGEGTRAGVGNLQACGSVHVCAVCAGKIQEQRNQELRRVLGWAQDQGHMVVMITLTVQHYQRHALAGLWDAVSAGWAGVTSGKDWGSERVDRFEERRDRWEMNLLDAEAGHGRYPYRGRQYVASRDSGDKAGKIASAPRRRIGDQERFGLLGWARVVEITSGRHGWHPHVHAVAVFEGNGPDTYSNAVQAGDRMHSRWKSALEKAGYVSDYANGGYHFTVAEGAGDEIADYLTKDQGIYVTDQEASASLAAEVVRGASKIKGKGRTPFQLLAAIDYENNPKESPQLEARWREFMDAAEGRQQMTWSAGLREMAGLAADQASDQEIADQEADGEVQLTIDAEAWDAGLLYQRVTICEVIEVEGLEGLRGFLDRGGWGYSMPTVVGQTEWAEVPDEDCQLDLDETPASR